MNDRHEGTRPEHHAGAPEAQQAREAVAGATERVRQGAESQKERAAGRLDHTAEALHRAAGALHERDESSLAAYIEQFAGTISEFSGSLRERSAADVLGQVESIARRNPSLFLGGAFAAGVVLGRFVRSSSRHEPDDDRQSRRDADLDLDLDTGSGMDAKREDRFDVVGPEGRHGVGSESKAHGDPLRDDLDIIREEPLGSEQAPVPRRAPGNPGDPSI